MPDTNDKIKALYNAASQKFDIGTEQDFRQKLTDPTKRKAFYDAASVDFDLGTYDEYEKKIGPTQKQIDEGKAMAAKVPSFKDFAAQRGVYVPKVGEIQVTSDIAERLPSLSTKAEIAKDVQEAPERIKLREERKEKAKADALKNNTIKALTASGTKFTEEDAVYKKMQENIKSVVEKGAMTLSADAAGNPVYKRSAGIIESFINNFEASRKDINDSEVFRKSSDAESVKIAEEIIKGIEQEAVPSGTAAEISGMFGSATPLLGRAVIGGGAAAKFLPGPAKAITALGSFGATLSPSYDQAYKQGAVELYAKGIEEMKRQKRIKGQSDELSQQEKEEAMRMAKNEASVSGFAEGIFVAGLSSIPLGSSVAGQSFKKAMVNFAKNTAKEVPRNVTLGAASEAIKDISAANAGYNITQAETLNNILERSGQDFITSVAFEVAFNVGDIPSVPKYVKAAATNYLSTIPTPEFNNFAKELEGRGVVEPGFAEKATADVNKFKDSKAKVADFIPEGDMPSFAGLIEKKTNLENQKKSTDPSFHAKIDEQIAAVDERIKKMQESPNPIFDEVDELTGDTGDATPITEAEIEKSIEYADGFTPEVTPSQEVEKRKSELQGELNDYKLKPLKLNMSDEAYKDLLDKRDARISEINSELRALEQPVLKVNQDIEETGKQLQDIQMMVNRMESLSTEERTLMDKYYDLMKAESLRNGGELSELYYKVKNDGSNPELVKQVEEFLSEAKRLKSIPVSDEKAEVERLRAEEQAELESAIPNIEEYKVDGVVDRTKITNEEELAKFDEIYDRYDKLITPLLEATKKEQPVITPEAPTEPSPFVPVEGFEEFEVTTKEGKKERYVNPDRVLAFSTIKQKTRQEQEAIISEIGEPMDARQAAMIALMGKPRISHKSFKEETGLKGTVKTKRGTQTEAAASIFTVQNGGNTVESVAEGIYENMSEEQQNRMSVQDIRNEILDLIPSYKDVEKLKDDYIRDYSPKEMTDEQAMNFYLRNAEEIQPIEKEWEDWSMERGEKEMALELDENYVDKLIQQYELTKEATEPTGRKKEGVVEEAGIAYATKEKGVIEGGDVKKYIDEQATPEESTDFDGFARKELAKEGFDAEYKSERVEGETKEQYLIRKYCK